MKCDQNVCLKILDEFENVWPETRSLGQIVEKLYVPCRRHIFSLILVKPGQNVCLNEISDK